MSGSERSGRMPKDRPEWTGDDPLDRDWPMRPSFDARRAPADEHDDDGFAGPLPDAPPDDENGSDDVAASSDDALDEPETGEEPAPELPPAPDEQLAAEAEIQNEVELAERRVAEHAAGEIDVPAGYSVIEGYPAGHRRAVAVVVGRFNGEITNRMLASALGALDAAGVERDAVTVMPVPGAFELPLGAMALAKTRRFSCIVALGCVIRGDTPHFDYVAGEAASGLQLAGIETGVPVAFGVLTCDTLDQAEARIDKGAEAVRTALEMADVFAQVRASARR